MKDRFNEPDIIDRLLTWSETRSARITGRRTQRGLGYGALACGVCFVADGVINQDLESIVYGVSGVFTGGVLAKFANIQLEQIRAEVPHD